MAHSFRDADHLPHQRSDGHPPDPVGLPRQRAGVTPQMHGRFPDYDVMAESKHWDPVTRELLQRRVDQVPPIRFFDPGEAVVLRAFLDVLLAQDAEPRIPVLELVDAKLAAGELDGYRYDDMPEDPQTWQLVARGLRELDFTEAPHKRQIDLVAAFASGELTTPAWDDLNVARAWSVVTRGAVGAFYAHPWAFNEIGFGGPAYPRGYMRRNMGPAGRDPGEPLEAFGLDPVQDLARRGEA